MYFRIAARDPFRPTRAPALERLLARADARSRVTGWRQPAYQAVAGGATEPPAIGAAQLHASGDAQRDGWVALATPVHLVAGMSHVQLPADGMLEIDTAEADRLAADFNRSFGGGGVRMARGRGSTLLCVFDSPISVQTASPEDALGEDVWTHQPRGPDAAALRRLSTEIEMWLFGHAVNAARAARGAPAISALWLWGGGAADAAMPAIEGWTAGNDALFSAFAPRAQYPRAAGSGSARPGVVVLSTWPGTPAWSEAERSWLEPAVDDLKAGRLRRIEISAAETSFTVSARGLARFWRKSRPWWEFFGIDAPPAQDGRLDA
ncbi:MAG TPA: hypothetical protein VHY75_11520 [Steroidobacteraceae bacterium]|nr:hypothetical protein [Steroidobacteraceae bacterium]